MIWRLIWTTWYRPRRYLRGAHLLQRNSLRVRTSPNEIIGPWVGKTTNRELKVS